MMNLIKGMGKAYLDARKAKKADKIFQSKRTDKYGPNQIISKETQDLNKKLTTAKKVGAGVAGTIGASAVYGKAKRTFKEKD